MNFEREVSIKPDRDFIIAGLFILGMVIMFLIGVYYYETDEREERETLDAFIQMPYHVEERVSLREHNGKKGDFDRLTVSTSSEEKIIDKKIILVLNENNEIVANQIITMVDED